MKKLLSFILSVCIISSTLCLAVFAKDKCDCEYAPVVYVVGQGEDLYLDSGTEDEKLVPDISGSLLKIIPEFVFGYIMQAIYGNYEALGNAMQHIVKEIIEVISCDKEGNSKYNVTVHPTQYHSDGRHIALKYGEENPLPIIPCDGKFIYDWRLDPMYNADLLKEYIEDVKAKTGHDKIIIMAHSEGNNVLCSYLYKYGSSDFEKVMFLSPAYQGLSILGSLFAGEYAIGDKSEELVTFLNTYLDNSALNNAIKTSVSICQKFGLVDLILNDAQKLLDNIYEEKIFDYLMDTIGTMPGMWSFCPDEYYERAKHRAFDGKDGYDVLIGKIDNYHYNVQNNVKEIIQNLLDKGVVTYIVSGYGISSIPVSNSSAQHSDLVIDTKYMSLGATCSEIGKTFVASYTQQINDSHNHLSPDMMIDASTCAFSDITFFIRDKYHDDNPPAFCQFLWELAYEKNQLDVFSFENYSQFMKYEDEKLINITNEQNNEEGISIIKIFLSLLDILKFSR